MKAMATMKTRKNYQYASFLLLATFETPRYNKKEKKSFLKKE